MPRYIMVKSKVGTMFSSGSVCPQDIPEDYHGELSVTIFPIILPFMSPQILLENNVCSKWLLGDGIHSFGDN